MNILVVGDLILDEYMHGRVRRISPEAPVPVLDAERSHYGLGGAANVALNVKTLGGTPHLVGMVADDNAGKKLLGMMQVAGLSTAGVFTGQGKTSNKVRLMDRQQLFRVDWDENIYMRTADAMRYIDTLELDGVILADYNKGVLREPDFIEQLMGLGKPVFVDPKFENFFAFRGATLFKPNVYELERAMGVQVHDNNLLQVCRELIERIRCKYLLLTLSENGMFLMGDGLEIQRPSDVKTLCDPAGAGDAVIAMMALGLSAGLDAEQTLGLASKAAAVACGKHGVQPVMRDEIT